MNSLRFNTKNNLIQINYHPGGMRMIGRNYQAGTRSYRYSINGQEVESELNKNITTALYWEYDSRIGIRWNLDPIQKVNESPYITFANNPVWFKDPFGNDTTKYYGNDRALLMTIGNGKVGYNRAMVIKDNKVQAVKKYAAKYSNILNSGKPIKNTADIDNSFIDQGYGDVYDLKSFSQFYETYKNTYNVISLRGVIVDKLKSIKLDGKSVTKDYLKSLKGAEATAVVKKVNGVFTVDFNSVSSDNDAFQSTRSYNRDMSNFTHIHLHPFWNINFEFTYNWDGKPQWRYEAAKDLRDGSITGDVDQNRTDGRTRGLPRTIVVSDKSIRLITGTLSETIYIQR
jgi:hypothetical protein